MTQWLAYDQVRSCDKSFWSLLLTWIFVYVAYRVHQKSSHALWSGMGTQSAHASKSLQVQQASWHARSHAESRLACSYTQFRFLTALCRCKQSQFHLTASTESLQDMQMRKKYRKADPADSDFLEEQGERYFNHSLRQWMHKRPSVLIFPEPAWTPAADDD